ncbi:DinB family protein [Kineococcus auxinigenes]|uniref:TIGR03086 family metal-binding protein n=1 Tax=unclassified Kineococcus TaxID=2621656 RepID=UPI003D7CEE5E
MTETPTSPAPASTAAGTDERAVFVLADEALLAVVRQVREDQWDLPTRAEVTTSDPDSDPTLRELLNYHAYDDAWVPAMLAGRTMAEVGEDAHSGDLLGADPVAAFERLVEDAVAAAQGLDDPDRTVHCSFGDYSARDYLWQVISFRALRAVEIARLIGADDQLEPELVEALLAYLRVHAEEWRSYGVFGPALPAPEGATAQEELLALTGRRPR